MLSRIAFLSCLSCIVFAKSLSLDFRFDSDSSQYDSAAQAALGKENSSQFTMRTGRVDFIGNLNDDLEFRLRWRLDKDSSTAVHKTDKFTSQIDYAYVQHSLTKNWKLTMGKLGSEIGSVEGNMSSPDIYLPSQIYSLLSTNGYLYVSGVKLTSKYDIHETSVYLANQSDTQADRQTKSMYGLSYQGHYLDDSLALIAGYLADEKQSSASTLPMNTQISSIGARYEPTPYFIGLDYLVYSQDNISDANADDVWTSIVLEGGYNFNGLMPKLKFESTEMKTSSVKNNYRGVTAGVEYKPYPKDLFRYHLMLTQLTTQPKTGPSYNEQHVLIGIRIYGDFLNSGS